MRVGQELKAARKKAGLSVEVISKRTKVKVSKLLALEKGDFKNLPTGLYLFSTVRAYAHEVHIDPEPIVERLRAEFADQDALDALQALDASGALAAKNQAKAGRSREERSNFLRSAAIAAGVVVIAAAGAGAGAYLYRLNHAGQESQSTAITPSSPAPAVNAPTDLPAVPPVPPAPVTTVVAAAIEVPEQAATGGDRTPPQKIKSSRRASRASRTQRAIVPAAGAIADTLGSSGVMPRNESSSPARVDTPRERTGSIEDLKLDGPALGAAP